MSKTDLIAFHEDKDLFREALEFSAAEARFPSRLVEKDYYCTLLLQYLTKAGAGLIFKGGTCLAKVHADFYRLSEDLDFSIPMPVDSTRSQRRGRVQDMKTAVQLVEEELPMFRVRTPMTGANRSTQYNAVLVYPSVLASEEEVIKIEVGMREPLVRNSVRGDAKTLLLDPVSESRAVPPVAIECLSWEEAMAEKLRAALTRREPAIRDFYDVYYGITKLNLAVLDPQLVEVVRAKLEVSKNEPIDVSIERLKSLHTQVETELQPVLRPEDFAGFDLDWTFSTTRHLATELDS